MNRCYSTDGDDWIDDAIHCDVCSQSPYRYKHEHKMIDVEGKEVTLITKMCENCFLDAMEKEEGASP